MPIVTTATKDDIQLLQTQLGLPLSRLSTTDKTQIINAINELFSKVNANYLTLNQKINSAAINFSQSII